MDPLWPGLHARLTSHRGAAGAAAAAGPRPAARDRRTVRAPGSRRAVAAAIVLAVAAAILVAVVPTPACAADASSPRIGVIVMHGKGGSPAGYVVDLATFLASKGYLVANLEMPWSGRSGYDVPVDAADAQVEAALADLRARGATKLFVAGHSQGGLFALHCGGRQPIDGIVAIAPGGNVAGRVFRDKLGESVATAHRLDAEGKGTEKARFLDFESLRGTSTVLATPVVYLTWFDPDGPMNQWKASQRIKPRIPVLFIVPKDGYPGLLRVEAQMFGALPGHPLTRLYEPDTDHVRAPTASREAIARWTAEVAASAESVRAQ